MPLMPPRPGDRFGPYELISHTGSGGMGDVFRARDTRVGRIVAIKFVHSDVVDRFEREARAIAALNHPNICQLYDVGPDYLVMEYVEGVPLRGPMPLQKALDYGAQICSALDAAHRQGIVHRDLKPANILATRSGVKVLDFGLAKLVHSPDDADADETATQALTREGTVVGTLHYMSPEQLQGTAMDTRSDLFSFGVVLFEMLTGKRPFQGDNQASIIASILTGEAPSIGNVQPAYVDRILQRCLRKDPEDRWQNARDLMFELASAAPPVGTGVPGKSRNWLVPVLGALLAVAGIAIVLLLGRRDSTATAGDWNVSLAPPPGSVFADLGNLSHATPEISPDGSMVVARIGAGLALRRLNSAAWMPLQGTESGSQVFWSADSRAIGFWQDARLMKMRVPDGAPEHVRDSEPYPRGGTWNAGGEILNSEAGGLWIGSASGGRATAILPSGSKTEPLRDPHWPHFLPDREHFIFSAYDATSPEGPVESRGIYLGGWRDGHWTLRPVRLKGCLNEARYSPANGGNLLFIQNDNLYAQRLNISSARLEDVPELLVQGVGTSTMFGNSHFSVSSLGPLAWRPGKAALAELTWFDRKGTVLGVSGPADAWGLVSLSPDERRIAALVEHGLVNEIRILEANKTGFLRLVSSSADRLLTFACLWLPGSDQILYVQEGGTGPQKLIQQSAAGGPTRELGPSVSFLNDISGDGKQLLIWGPRTSLAVVPFPPNDSDPQRVTGAEGLINTGAISPDGKWVVYSGPSALFVHSLKGAVRQQISENRGMMPAWRRDGREIVYLGADHRIWSVPVDPSRGEFGTAVPLFPIRAPSVLSQSRLLAVTRDGSRILFAQAVDQPESNLIDVVQDWMRSVRKPGAP